MVLRACLVALSGLYLRTSRPKPNLAGKDISQSLGFGCYVIFNFHGVNCGFQRSWRLASSWVMKPFKIEKVIQTATPRLTVVISPLGIWMISGFPGLASGSAKSWGSAASSGETTNSALRVATSSLLGSWSDSVESLVEKIGFSLLVLLLLSRDNSIQ
jgi:hypothetical protein